MELVSILAAEDALKPVSSTIEFVTKDDYSRDIPYRLRDALGIKMESFLAEAEAWTEGDSIKIPEGSEDIEIIKHETYHAKVYRKGLHIETFLPLEEAQAQATGDYYGGEDLESRILDSKSSLQLYKSLMQRKLIVSGKDRRGDSRWLKHLYRFTYGLFYWPCAELIAQKGLRPASMIFYNSLRKAIEADDINAGVKWLLRGNEELEKSYDFCFKPLHTDHGLAATSRFEGGKADVFTNSSEVLGICSSIIPNLKRQ
ncbi:MAG: hypothetical protein ABIB71_02085 [Candidatus Woesearchaeota archaeon]